MVESISIAEFGVFGLDSAFQHSYHQISQPTTSDTASVQHHISQVQYNQIDQAICMRNQIFHLMLQDRQKMKFVPSDISYLVPSDISYLVPSDISYLVPSDIPYLVPSHISYLVPLDIRYLELSDSISIYNIRYCKSNTIYPKSSTIK